MLRKTKNAVYIIFFTIFIFLITKYYFSEENRILINKTRSTYSIERLKLRVLKNDTNNIIEYKNELDDFNNKRKKRIWEKLISDRNE